MLLSLLDSDSRLSLTLSSYLGGDKNTGRAQ